MATQTGLTALPGGDPSGLEAAAAGMRRAAGQLRDAASGLARSADRLASAWSGPASEPAGERVRRAGTLAAVAPRVADVVATVLADHAGQLRAAVQAPAGPPDVPAPAGAVGNGSAAEATTAASAAEAAVAERVRQLTAELVEMRPDPYGPVVGRPGEPSLVGRPQGTAGSSSLAEPGVSWDPGWVAKASLAFGLLAAPAAYAERLATEAATLGADARAIKPQAGAGQQARRAYKQAQAAVRQHEARAGRAAAVAARVPGSGLSHSLGTVAEGVPVLRTVPVAGLVFTGLGIGADVAGGTSVRRALTTNVAATGAALAASSATATAVTGGLVAVPAAAVVALPLAAGAVVSYGVYRGVNAWGDDVARGAGRAAASTGRALAVSGRVVADTGRAAAGAGRELASDAGHAATGAARDARRTWHRVFG